VQSACRLNDQTLRALAEAPAQRPADDPYALDHRADTYLNEVKRFLFNVLLFLGSLPEEYEPDQVLRAAREKKGHLRPELRAARFLGKEAYRPASRPTGAEEHQPTGRKLQGHWRAGHWRPAILRGRELAAKTDLDRQSPGRALRRVSFHDPFSSSAVLLSTKSLSFPIPQALFWFKERCSARCQVQRKIPGQPRLDFQGISHAAKDSSRLIRDLTHLVFFHCNQRSASNS
jgi:hypothetical protein